MSVSLSRLSCPSCSEPLSAGPGDTVFFCRCGRGCTFTPQGLEIVEAAAYPAPSDRPPQWEPAWELVADVLVAARRNAAGGSAVPPPIRRRLLIPARPMELSRLLAQVRAWSSLPAADQQLPGVPILGGDLSSDEAAALARYAVFAEQVAQPDSLIELQVDLSVRSIRLIAVP
ncbi:MAG: hypothetical protein U0V87_14495 [Acidobacteriota bacterium]